MSNQRRGSRAGNAVQEHTEKPDRKTDVRKFICVSRIILYI